MISFLSILGSFLALCADETGNPCLILYHGGHRWEDPPTIKTHRRGHAECGPGIYLTTSYETAQKYAKGGGVVYRVLLDYPIGWAENTRIQIHDAISFVKNTLGKGKKAKAVTEAIGRVAARTGETIPASSMIAIFVNNDVASGAKGPALAEFLVNHGVDASLVQQGNEDWIVVFNPTLLRRVERVTPRNVGEPGFLFDLPKIER